MSAAARRASGVAVGLVAPRRLALAPAGVFAGVAVMAHITDSGDQGHEQQQDEAVSDQDSGFDVIDSGSGGAVAPLTLRLRGDKVALRGEWMAVRGELGVKALRLVVDDDSEVTRELVKLYLLSDRPEVVRDAVMFAVARAGGVPVSASVH